LLLQYLGFGILLTFLYIGLQPLDEILDGITKRLFNYGAMWFIPVLFVTELMFFHISKIRKRPLIYCMIILSVFIGWLLYYFQINLPLSLSACFVALFFYGLGFLGKNFADKLFDKMILLPVFLVAQFTVILLSSHSVIGMMQNVISQPFYNISAAIFGLLAFCMICKILSNINRWWIKLIVYFGKNTMTILCLHMCFIGYASEYVKPLFNTKIVYKGIEFVLVCAMCMFSVWLKQVLWIMVNRTNK
jgi:fucose 4-O-acetylase-like acetyltransferase